MIPAQPTTRLGRPSLRCAVTGCSNDPLYGGLCESRKRCEQHRLPTDVGSIRKATTCLGCHFLDKGFKSASYKVAGFARSALCTSCSRAKESFPPEIKTAIFNVLANDFKEEAKISLREIFDKSFGAPPVSVRKDTCKECEKLGQGKIGTFGLPSDPKVRYCIQHKLPEMIDLVGKKCSQCPPEHKISATFGFPPGVNGGGIKDRCGAHREPGMINLTNAMCQVCLLGASHAPGPIYTQANYGLASDGKRVSCSSHKTPEMINLSSPICVTCLSLPLSAGGSKRVCAHYGPPGGKKLYCSSHKEPGMINLNASHCEVCLQEHKILTVASYGISKKTHCSRHKSPEMLNLSSPMCTECLEQTVASYGFLYNKKKVACKAHSLPGMVDLSSKMCDECLKEDVRCQASYGYDKKLTCYRHRKPDMITLTNEMCEKCLSEGFRVVGAFGLESDGKRISCTRHKTSEMVNLSTQQCDDCLKVGVYRCASYGFDKRIKCITHKTDEMKDLANEMCPGGILPGKIHDCPYNKTATAKYDFYCIECFAHNFPTDPRTAEIRTHSKELRVVSYLTNRFPELEFIHDKPLIYNQVDCDCTTRRRIDLRTYIDGTMLAIEVDERQHKSYSGTQKDQPRYDDLFIQHGFISKYVFIRYNPDSFKIGRVSQNPTHEARMFHLYQKVVELVCRIREGKNRELLEIHYLFYDQP